jgi:hypothetical protein
MLTSEHGNNYGELALKKPRTAGLAEKVRPFRKARKQQIDRFSGTGNRVLRSIFP